MKIVRLANLSELDPLVKLARVENVRFLDKLVNDYNTGENTFSAEGEALFTVFVGGELVAVGGLNINPYQALEHHTRVGLIARLRRVYVHPGYRRRGIGAALVRRIELGASPYFELLYLFTDSPRAVTFYESLGYSPVKHKKVSHYKRLTPT